MCVFTFLDHYDLTGKKLAPLCTNEGSGLANSVSDLQKNYPTAVVTEGLSVRGHQAQESEDMIAEWAKSVLA
jgi:flavodoxin